MIQEYEWKEYYQELLIGKWSEFTQNVNYKVNPNELQYVSIEEEETRRAIKGVKKKKSPGTGGIPNELIK